MPAHPPDATPTLTPTIGSFALAMISFTLSAALSLLDRGYHVTLIEKRPFFGGRAFSFRDGDTGVEVDNGQHVFLGCCTYYTEYLKSIGSYDGTYLQNGLRIEVVSEGESGVLLSTPALGRFHLLPSFIKYPHLSIRGKILAAYGLLRAHFINRSRDSRLDDESAYAWLKRHGQTEHVIDNLWNLIILPALNDDVRNVSADMALMVIQEGILNGPGASSVGYSKVGLTTLNGDPAQQFIEGRGGDVLLGLGVKELVMDGGIVGSVKLTDGNSINADAYVSALPNRVLHDLIDSKPNLGEFVSSVDVLEEAPIVGIHFWYDRHVMDGDFVAFLNSPVQFVFNKSHIQGRAEETGQYLCVSLSGAWDYIDMPKSELVDMFTCEMARLFHRASDAAVTRVLVVKERNATFRCIPGNAKRRPGQVTVIPNLFLAGDWTDTGWPATMEAAFQPPFWQNGSL